MEDYTAPGYPFVIDSTGKFKMSSGDKLLEKDMIQAVKITKGSRPMFKDIGNVISHMLFSNDLGSRRPLIKKILKETIEESVPDCEILDVNIIQDEDNDTSFKIYITYKKQTESRVKTVMFIYD